MVREIIIRRTDDQQTINNNNSRRTVITSSGRSILAGDGQNSVERSNPHLIDQEQYRNIHLTAGPTINSSSGTASERFSNAATNTNYRDSLNTNSDATSSTTSRSNLGTSSRSSSNTTSRASSATAFCTAPTTPSIVLAEMINSSFLSETVQEIIRRKLEIQPAPQMDQLKEWWLDVFKVVSSAIILQNPTAQSSLGVHSRDEEDLASVQPATNRQRLRPVSSNRGNRPSSNINLHPQLARNANIRTRRATATPTASNNDVNQASTADQAARTNQAANSIAITRTEAQKGLLRQAKKVSEGLFPFAYDSARAVSDIINRANEELFHGSPKVKHKKLSEIQNEKNQLFIAAASFIYKDKDVEIDTQSNFNQLNAWHSNVLATSARVEKCRNKTKKEDDRVIIDSQDGTVAPFMTELKGLSIELIGLRAMNISQVSGGESHYGGFQLYAFNMTNTELRDLDATEFKYFLTIWICNDLVNKFISLGEEGAAPPTELESKTLLTAQALICLQRWSTFAFENIFRTCSSEQIGDQICQVIKENSSGKLVISLTDKFELLPLNDSQVDSKHIGGRKEGENYSFGGQRHSVDTPANFRSSQNHSTVQRANYITLIKQFINDNRGRLPARFTRSYRSFFFKSRPSSFVLRANDDDSQLDFDQISDILLYGGHDALRRAKELLL